MLTFQLEQFHLCITSMMVGLFKFQGKIYVIVRNTTMKMESLEKNKNE